MANTLMIVVAFIASLSYTSGEKCECATFFLGDVKDEHKVYAVPNINLEDCTKTDPCKEYCETTFRKLTNNGNLTHITSRGITVAQVVCKNYGKDIKDGILSAQYKPCDGDWTVAVNMKSKLSCKGGKAEKAR